MMVSVPAAASKPSSYPDVLAVLVIVAAMGLAFTDVSVLARRSSTQEYIKQKNIATPIPAAIVGIKILIKNRQNE